MSSFCKRSLSGNNAMAFINGTLPLSRITTATSNQEGLDHENLAGYSI